MQIKKWMGLVSAASPYSLPPGAVVRQNNVQVRKPGQLTPRDGMELVVASRSGPVLGLHRTTVGGGLTDTIICYRRNDIGGVDYTLEVVNEASQSTTFAQIFSTQTAPTHRPSFCQDRHGTTYVFFGSGIRPQIYRAKGSQAIECGIDSPTIAPSVTAAGDGFFIERVDVIAAGGSYFSPPTITASGGNADRQAQLRAVIQGGSLVAVDVVDGGSNYRSMPTITISGEQIGSGFLGRGNIATSAATYGFRDTDTPQSTSGSYTATYTHAFSTTAQPVTIAYRETPAGSPTVQAAATFDASGTNPVYTALIPLAPVSTTWSTTATLVATDPNITVASAANIQKGTELQLSSTYFDSNPVVTNVVGTTVTLDRASKASGSGVAVTIVKPANAFAQVQFSTLSSGWKLGNTTITEVAEKWTTTTTNIASGSATLVVASAANIAINDVLVVPPGFYATAPTVTNKVGNTLTLDQNAIASATAAVNIGVRLASTSYTTDNPAGSQSYKWRSLQQNWYTTDDYFQNTSNSSGTRIVSSNYNKDKFWGLMPSTEGYFFTYNQAYSTNSTNTAYLYGNFFFPDYYGVGYRLLTGREDQASSESSWTVGMSYLFFDSNGEPYIDIELQPMKKPITGASYSTTQDTAYPYVRVHLAFCPSSWVLDDFQPTGTNRAAHYYNPQMGQWRRVNQDDTDPAGPAAAGGTLTASGTIYPRNSATLDTAKRWWGFGLAALVGYQPIVDCRTGPSDPSSSRGIQARSVQIIDPGAQMEKGTKFRLRLEQYNAYDYRVVARASYEDWQYDVDSIPAPLAVSVASMNRNGAFGTTYTDFVFEANELDTAGSAAALLLPGDVVGTPKVVVAGTKWGEGQDGGFRLRQQDPANPGTFSDGKEFTFRAKEIIPASASQRISEVTIISGGVNYYREPTLLVRGGGGYGLKTSAVMSNGVITSVVVLDGGDGFTSQPTLYTSVEPAKVMPVLRGTMQGAYRCAYRFADYSQTVVATNLTLTTTAGSKTATLTAPTPAPENISLVKPNMKLTGTSAVSHLTGILAVAPLSATSRTITLSQPALETRSAAACTVRDMERPIAYSDFSPIVDVEASSSGYNRASRMVWTLAGVTAPARADFVEFFRTSADQSLLFYRLEQYGTVSSGSVTIVGSDTLSDEELFDFDRPGYAAMPVVLPNGALNAYRFGVPRSDMAVAVAFQDRLWYGVSTSGADSNTVFFSELDEFESCPELNELPIQNNLRSTDYLTALVPFGSSLLAMQTSHCYAIAYNSDPSLDATVQLTAHRGCLCQQAWDVYDDLLYVADERGIYRMSRGGDVENLSDDVRDYFDEGKINYVYRRSTCLKVDQTTGILRFFYTPAGVDSDVPTAALCLHIANKTWWTESWPNSITSATDYRGATGKELPVYGAADGNIYRFAGTRDFAYRDIVSVNVTFGGSGYVTPPTVTVADPNGRGAQFKALLTNGVVTEILVIDGGHGYGAFAGPTFAPTVNLTLSTSPTGQTALATAQARHPYQDMDSEDSLPPRTSVPWRVRTGPMAIATDAVVKGGDRLFDRSITVTYQPTAGNKTLILREYYNNSDEPRPNSMRRDRGTGWVHETVGARATLEMNAARSSLGMATGLAKATFAGRSMDDVGSADRHLAVELSCDPVLSNASSPPETVIYGLEIRGVGDGD